MIRAAAFFIMMAVFLAPAGAVDRAIDAGDRLMAAKEYEKALNHWDRLLKDSPGSAELLLRKGIALSMLERLDEAETTLKDALDRAPDDPKVLMNLGFLAQRRNQVDRAEEYFLKVAANKPWYPNVYLSLGGIAEQRGKPREALDFYVKEINNSGHGDAWRHYLRLKNEMEPPRPLPAFVTPLLVVLAAVALIFLVATILKVPEKTGGIST